MGGVWGTGETNIYLISEFKTYFMCQVLASVHKVLKGFRHCNTLLKGPLFLFCLFVSCVMRLLVFIS